MKSGEPDEANVHDLMEPALGKAIPYGVYDLSENQGWVSVGVDHDTARFATAAIGRWWKKTGSRVAIPLGIRLEAVGVSLTEVLDQCRSTGILSPYLINQTHRGGSSRPLAPS